MKKFLLFAAVVCAALSVNTSRAEAQCAKCGGGEVTFPGQPPTPEYCQFGPLQGVNWSGCWQSEFGCITYGEPCGATEFALGYSPAGVPRSAISRVVLFSDGTRAVLSCAGSVLAFDYSAESERKLRESMSHIVV